MSEIRLEFAADTPYPAVDDALSKWIKEGYMVAELGESEDKKTIFFNMKLFKGECKECQS